ncbi:MAG: TetR/AcrR family transcriptional regulator [Labilithrix sp.]|nr:TetR/AcrR family transcriptional regulator [Labilithrix sp.]MCW5832246.1 TetR/AcrR family transcriptional regulator [Labilithrix sp.]
MAKRPDDDCDPRVLRTRRILHEALLELAHERDLDTLSIADVAERAQVNRATFYAHYRSLDELLDVALQFELEGLTTAVTSRTDIFEDAELDEPPKYVLATVRTLERRLAVYRRVFSSNGSAKVVHGFRQRIAEEIEKKLRDGSLKSVRPLPTAVEAYAVAGSLVAILVYWFGAKSRPSSQRVAGWLWHVLSEMRPGPGGARSRSE